MQQALQVELSTGSTSEPDLEAEIARLRREHRELKARLSELNSRLRLSVEEQMERKTIQKLKLLKKDQLLQLESRLRN